MEDVVSVALRLEGGGLATIHQAYALSARGYRGGFAVRGTRASLEIGLDESVTVLRASAAIDGLVCDRTDLGLPPVPGYGTAGLAALRDLVACIRDGGEPRAGAQDLVAALRLVDAAYASIRTGRHIVPIRPEEA